MHISDLFLSNKLFLSFEIFPPKQETSVESVRATALEIASLSPAFISVTYGAGGSTRLYTVDIAREIRQNTAVPPMAHLTCVSSDREAVRAQAEAIHAAGIENILALRGDLPQDPAAADRSTGTPSDPRRRQPASSPHLQATSPTFVGPCWGRNGFP